MLTIDDVAAVPLFSGLPPTELERLARTSADLHLCPGEFAVPRRRRARAVCCPYRQDRGRGSPHRDAGRRRRGSSGPASRSRRTPGVRCPRLGGARHRSRSPRGPAHPPRGRSCSVRSTRPTAPVSRAHPVARGGRPAPPGHSSPQAPRGVPPCAAGRPHQADATLRTRTSRAPTGRTCHTRRARATGKLRKSLNLRAEGGDSNCGDARGRGAGQAPVNACGTRTSAALRARMGCPE